ncbi:ABC transporter substrate-binding protein [Cellulomonas aerilata]|uniref:ABC transporter substrate-binding protein n=1 Tax=Cellulomonas aerilata TaxID=515326 RepID=A0A512D8Y8_9CELL|nr:extracellular solute-binding protein [Cellulomonas aerilata]GEO32952.1 ABC transporter substrate-binding protein [Cellulomonas aerilata]
MAGYPRSIRRAMSLPAVVGVTALALTACSGGGDDAGGDSGGGSEFSVLSVNENTTVSAVLEALAADQCATQNEAMPLAVENLPQAQLGQQLQLLAGQDALPMMFGADNPTLTKELAEAGQVLDLEGTGAADNFEPAAVATIENLYDGLWVLPTEFNIEGIWYNEQVFADNGVEVPATWDDLVAAAETLSAAGVQPFSASGEQGWPLTRLISGYLYRDLGPEALQAVVDGDAKLTDPEYVAGAQAVADLGAEGWFGQGVGSIDYDTALNTFLTGDAAMLYMGSWALSNFANPEQNQIGEDNIGFMPFPDVEGGSGSADQYPANVGLPFAVSAKATSDDAQAWLDCIAENYGTQALTEANQITGFTVNEEVEVGELTATVQEAIAATEQSVLWLEAPFSPQFQTVSTTNAAPLVTGGVTPEDFMSQLQAAIDAA